MAATEHQLVARGRAILLVLIGTLVLLQVLWVFIDDRFGIPGMHTSLHTVFWYGLWFAIWRGRSWAVSLVKNLSGFGVIACLIFWASSREPVLLEGAVVAGVQWACLAKSKSVSAYLRHRGRNNGHERLEQERVAERHVEAADDGTPQQ